MAGDPVDCYARHGPLTDPGPHSGALDGLPVGVGPLVDTVQGLLIHDAGLHLYGLTVADFAGASRATRPVSERLAAALGRGALTDRRPPVERIFGTCRDYALLLTAFLRHQGVPARVRCGFARYFRPGFHEDHWICEHWLAGDRRWARADAQMDAAHRARLGIDWDITDLPDGMFLTAGEAWRLVRTGAADPAGFGHGSVGGEWFIRVNLARDLLALGKQEVSDWDSWRDAAPASPRLDDGARSWCDAVAVAGGQVDRNPDAVTTGAGRMEPFWR